MKNVELGKEISEPLIRKMYTEEVKKELQIISKKCKKHPKYKAIRKPGCDCDVCWAIYQNLSRYDN